MIFAVDFDGTVVKHKYPEIGESIGAEPVLRNLVKNGHRIILYTMRGHNTLKGRDVLQEAVDWFKDNGIELYGVNENPEQHTWTDSPKPHANYYIDDHALGCPMKRDDDGSAYVDWGVLDNWFKATGIIDTRIGWPETDIY